VLPVEVLVLEVLELEWERERGLELEREQGVGLEVPGPVLELEKPQLVECSEMHSH
jgi:hypothetical protein